VRELEDILLIQLQIIEKLQNPSNIGLMETPQKYQDQLYLLNIFIHKIEIAIVQKLIEIFLYIFILHDT
jgi:hypothetical protein